jgi:hypothetical protein
MDNADDSFKLEKDLMKNYDTSSDKIKWEKRFDKIARRIVNPNKKGNFYGNKKTKRPFGK